MLSGLEEIFRWFDRSPTMSAIVGGLMVAAGVAVVAACWKGCSWIGKLIWHEVVAGRNSVASREQADLQAERMHKRAEMAHERDMEKIPCGHPDHPTGKLAPRWFTTKDYDPTDDRRTIDICFACDLGCHLPLDGETRAEWIYRMEAESLKIPNGWESSAATARRTCDVCNRHLPMEDTKKTTVTTGRVSRSGRSCVECINLGKTEVGSMVGAYNNKDTA